MEHLSLEVAAAPLRLIAAKNEKSRGELGRFLAKQVRTRARGGCPAALPRRALPPGERGAAPGHPGRFPRAGPWRGVRRHGKEPLFFLFGGSRPFLSPLTDPRVAGVAFGKKCFVLFFSVKQAEVCPFAMCFTCVSRVQPPLLIRMNVFLFCPVHSFGHWDKYRLRPCCA